MRQAAEDIDDAIDRAHQPPLRQRSRGSTNGAESVDAEHEAADHRRQREIGADREIDAAGEDDRDCCPMATTAIDRGLRQDVADIARRQEMRCRRGRSPTRSTKDQERPGSEQLRRPSATPEMECRRRRASALATSC